MQYFRAEAGQLEHFFKSDGIEAARFGHDARVGGVNAVHVGVDLAFVGLEGGGKCDGRGVRTAAAQRGDVARAADALETGDDDDAAFSQIGTHFLVVYAFDAGFGVGGIGFQGNLPAGIAFCVHADVFQRHRQEADGHLFAGGQDHIQFARVGVFLHFVRQCHQTVGFAAHGGNDHDHVMTFGAGFGNTVGYVFDAFGGTYRCSAVFLYD